MDVSAVLAWPAYVYRAAALTIRDHPPMATAGPRSVAEGFATVLRCLTSGSEEVPYWIAAPSLYTLPVHRAAQAQQAQAVDDDAPLNLPGLHE